uniref:MULE transposase domain-containing protein n=1 Tax=Bionectria ochroleuca TaxID=29856 RepID=A0A8H7K5T0_BIOOC
MDQARTTSQFPDDCLPPERDYGSREALHTAINAWAAPRGYAFVTGKSKKTESGRRIVFFSCDRGGAPPNSSNARRRMTTTRRTGCQFSVLAKEALDKTMWRLAHRPGREFAHHNHEPSTNLSAHPVHRQLSHADRSTINNLANAGVAPKEIRSYLRQNTQSRATQQDIYNCIAQGKRDQQKGQSTIHALANELEAEGFWSRIRFDQDGRVTAVLFAHPESLAYLKSYPDILILDCTYKTNKYKMPLLDIVGVDACQRSFCIAFAFLGGEEEKDYVWALDRLRSMYEACGARMPSVILTDRCLACMNAVSHCFPAAVSLLCLWHANKAVLRYCQPSFMRHNNAFEEPQGHQEWKDFYGKWHELLASTNEETFEDRLQQLKDRYTSAHVREVAYIIETWLDLHKKKLVKAWVDQHLHFENVVTSRGEGIHQLIKKYLDTSQLDLFEAWRAIKLAILNQVAELRANQAKQQVRTPIELSGSLYSIIRGWVSHEALRKVEAQRKRLQQDRLPACTGVFSATLGLPCAHVIEPLMRQEQPLQLQHFHTHWHLQREGEPHFLLEPRRQFNQVVARSTLPSSSTRREPCAFEAIEQVSQMRIAAKPTCSRCHTQGHTMSSKACPLRYAHLRPYPTPTALPNMLLPSVTPASAPLPVPDSSLSSILPRRQAAPAAPSDQELLPFPPDTGQPSSSSAGMPPSPDMPPSAEPETRYDHPCAIYHRYIAARTAWYNKLPRGSLKTNQQYRKAMGLPQRYDKASYNWCLDYKQMGKRCTATEPSREWTKEEMIAYLDWNKAEDKRVEARVAEEIRKDRLTNRRRGMNAIWKSIELDIIEQEALYSNNNQTKDSITVAA